ncbi:MBL fold metallo-hydrolase [Mongoliimonas terrestris]|uniref:MBL fold metallo-hydrolase n=1 Tax=Mongoliimonas terrestris TaxID=1709001 RepID=UPI0009495671|nr:MBL fold metallo-hydrolase [Mongoliimonas terrestris]
MTAETFTLDRRHLMVGALSSITLASGGLMATTTSARAQAPEMLGASKPGHYRFRLGTFEVTTLLDGLRPGDGPHPIFGANQSQEDVAALLAANFLPGERFVNGFTPVLVNTGTDLVLFDTGFGAGAPEGLGRLAAQMQAAGYTPEQVTIVVLTHLHGDHIGGLMGPDGPTFPNARYVTGAREYDFWTKTAPGTQAADAAKNVEAKVVPLAEKMTFLEDGGSVVSGITAEAAFGHTPGHMVYQLESEGRRLMLTADTANHYVVSLQRPDWEVRFDADKAAAAATRKAVFGQIAADRIPFIGYHMPFPAVGYVEPLGEGFRWVPATYQLDL